MKEHPILMATESVKAILDGRKTQTRRVIKEAKTSATAKYFDPKLDNWPIDQGTGRKLNCPYGQVGDRLWVRESFYTDTYQQKQDKPVFYKADGDIHSWKPSIFMPRWASRITLEITGVRVERVQGINAADCFKEGVEMYKPIQQFQSLWDSLNAKRGYGWEVNPWVWVIEFKREVLNNGI